MVSTRSAVLVALLPLGFGHLARAQATEEDGSGWSVEGAYTWTWTYGNDVRLGNQFSVDLTSSPGSSRFEANQVLKPLLTEMQSRGQPFLRVSYDGGRWGFSGEASWLETDGSLSGTTPRMTGVELWEYRFDDAYDMTYEARNELSLWTVRFDVTRELSRWLTLTAGVHGGRLENSRSETSNGETEDPFFTFFFDLPDRLQTEAKAKMDATVIGPSVGLCFIPALGERWRLSLSGRQSFLFTRAKHEADLFNLESYGSFDLFFPFPMEAVNTLETELSTSSLVPVSELRTTVHYALGDHVAIGATALVSLWLDVPQALRFSFRTAWEEPKTTLSFVNFGPFVKVTF